MHKSLKCIAVICFISAIGLSQVFAVGDEILPSDIADYTSFFNQHYRLAIDGNSTSQLYIGALYEKGLGVKKDLMLSHVYYNLASATGTPDAKEHRKRIENLLSKKEFAEARKLVKLFMPRIGLDHPRQTDSLSSEAELSGSQSETNSENSVAESTTTTSSNDIHTNFFNAVKDNNITEVNMLISSGVDINYRFNDDKTALMLASEYGNLSTVGTLLDLGADANLKSENNRTALSIARDSGHEHIAAMLRTKTLIPSQLIKEIQIYLRKLQYNPGRTDGLYGKSTKRSLQRFSRDYNQNHPIETSQQQLDTLRTAYNSYITKKTNELKLQESNAIEKYPDITGTYYAQTAAISSNCGANNHKIQYYAEENIKNQKEDGNFEISYHSPLVKCSGKGKFTLGANAFNGKYNCSYKTSGGINRTSRMKIVGQIKKNTIEIKYNGKDTTPGQTCFYTWERTLAIE